MRRYAPVIIFGVFICLIKSGLLCLFILIPSAWGSSIEVTGYLWPSGIFQITSDRLLGVITKEPSKVISQKISVPVKSLTTGISLRDTHLHQFLNSKKYPKIKMTKVIVSGAAGTGEITINNVTKPVKFKVQSTAKSYICFFKLNWKDFGLKEISFMGVKPKDVIEIKISVDKSKILDIKG